jgi:hypothetical protein
MVGSSSRTTWRSACCASAEAHGGRGTASPPLRGDQRTESHAVASRPPNQRRGDAVDPEAKPSDEATEAACRHRASIDRRGVATASGRGRHLRGHLGASKLRPHPAASGVRSFQRSTGARPVRPVTRTRSRGSPCGADARQWVVDEQRSASACHRHQGPAALPPLRRTFSAARNALALLSKDSPEEATVCPLAEVARHLNAPPASG